MKALLADMPQLFEWTLADDTPLANAETKQWLKDQAVLPGAEPAPARPAAPPAAAPRPRRRHSIGPAPPRRWSGPPQDGQGGEPAPPDAYDLAWKRHAADAPGKP